MKLWSTNSETMWAKSVDFHFLHIYFFHGLYVSKILMKNVLIKRNSLCPRHFQWGVGGGGHIVSLLSVCTSISPVCNTFGFRAISFEGIGVLD